MKTKELFTADFFSNPQLTLDIFNKLLSDNHVACKDMYESGNFLFFEVFENDKTKEILSSVISDLEAYKTRNNENFVTDEETEISLNLLHEEHCKLFYRDGKEIKWDGDCFVFEDYLVVDKYFKK